MKKETIVAIFLGLLFGGILAFMISLKNKEIQLTKSKIITPPKEKNVSSNLSGIELQPLELIEPVDKSIFESNIIRLKGTAAKDSLILIQSPIKDLAVRNKQEKFD